MAEIKVSKTRKLFYLGVPAKVTDYSVGSGRRVTVLEWLGESVGQPVVHPAGTFEVLDTMGTGSSAQVIRKAVASSHDEADAQAREWLTAEPVVVAVPL